MPRIGDEELVRLKYGDPFKASYGNANDLVSPGLSKAEKKKKKKEKEKAKAEAKAEAEAQAQAKAEAEAEANMNFNINLVPHARTRRVYGTNNVTQNNATRNHVRQTLSKRVKTRRAQASNNVRGNAERPVAFHLFKKGLSLNAPIQTKTFKDRKLAARKKSELSVIQNSPGQNSPGPSPEVHQILFQMSQKASENIPDFRKKNRPRGKPVPRGIRRVIPRAPTPYF
jgi:hypothetical protein